MRAHLWTSVAYGSSVSAGALIPRQSSNVECPGYSATNIRTTKSGLIADLSLAGPACNSYGTDIETLTITVNHDTAQRLHVKITDAADIAFQVPTSVFPRPDASNSSSEDESELDFSYETTPFSFRVSRKTNGEVLFDTSTAPLIFQDQYMRLRTSLPENPNLYGLGEHTDNFRLNTTNYTRTLWSRDAYGVPTGTNLYGNHPVYIDHRGDKGTHGVFLLASSGMDVNINRTPSEGQYLEYNLMSGMLDLYFVAGPSPQDVSRQYAEIVGLPAMMPYWGFGLHQCRYGYRDFYAIAEVVTNYSAAGIPLETMWTDIDYMYERYIMTTDPDRFPVPRMREFIDYLHAHDQHYVVMVDPAVAYQETKYDNLTYDTFATARDNGYFLHKNGQIFKGVVWPGVTAFPDWFHPGVQAYWNKEFATFFDADSGVDIDALWIDMNEAANFNYFGDDPDETAVDRGFPPQRPELRSQPRAIPGFPAEFQPGAAPYPPDDFAYAPPWLAPPSNPNDNINNNKKKHKRGGAQKPGNPKRQTIQSANHTSIIGFPDRDLLSPPYQINNENTHEDFGGLSNFTLDTDIVHYDGHVELDVHNLYGSMMSKASRDAMLARRPGRRPLVITRSTFAGAGRDVGKWLGDNLSTWEQYRNSIQGMLNFASIFQMPMVGADICGFGGNTTETLCARWATLGAFYTFMRNHNGDTSLPQEFYMWPTVAEAARSALDLRYRLLDYIYTAFHQQTLDGTPVLSPLFYIYPTDAATFSNQLQFFYGPSLLVSPVTDENATSVTIYLPDDRFYEWGTWAVVDGAAQHVQLHNISFTEIPVHVRGGSVIPLRHRSGYTTTETRRQPFDIVVAPDRQGRAKGSLYLDDGDSIEQTATSEIEFAYEDGCLQISGTFGYSEEGGMRLASVLLLGPRQSRQRPSWRSHGNGKHQHGRRENDDTVWAEPLDGAWSEDQTSTVVTMNEPLRGDMTILL